MVRADRKKLFDESYIPEPNSGCWLWVGSMDGKVGYGLMTLEKKTMGAHRASWILHNGEIPKGMLICHKCDVRLCVNPNHLYVGTYTDNARDTVKRNRGKTGFTHCKRGHEFNKENTEYGPMGFLSPWRKCKQCALATSKRNTAKRSERRRLKRLGVK